MGLLQDVFQPLLNALPEIEIPEFLEPNKGLVIKFKEGGKVNWIQGVTKEIDRKGTRGLFTRKAKRHGLTPVEYAKRVIANPAKHTIKTFREAMFVKNVNPELFATKRASGGSVRYSSKRKGPSNSATWYSPGEIQIGNDGNYWIVKQNVNGVNRWQKMTRSGLYAAKGGKTQGYAARQDESLGMRTGKESSKKQSMKARREDSYGKWGKRDAENRGTSMARGGKTQGYNARLDESLGSRTGRRGTKSQSYKSRRDESKGTEKYYGRRPYSSVGTMDFEL